MLNLYPTKNEKPEPYDGKRKGVVGVVLALTRISQQLDYLIRLKEQNS